MSFSQITKTTFDPLLKSRSQVKRFLQKQTQGTAHPHQEELLYKHGDDVKSVNIADKPPSYFMDTANLNELGDVLAVRLEGFRPILGDVVDYSVVTPTSQIIDIPFEQDKVLLFALSVNNEPSYYDLCVSDKSCYICCYSHVVHGPCKLKHSGDQLMGNVLLQSLTTQNCNPQAQEPFVVFLSGYTNKQLHLYKKQNPTVLLVNHSTKTLYMLPVPLDKATIGEATVCCPTVGKRIRDVIRFTLLPNPATCCNVSVSGSVNTLINPSILRSFEMANAFIPTAPAKQSSAPPTTIAEIDDASTKEPSAPSVDASTKENIVIIEGGLDLPSWVPEDAYIIQFARGIQTYSNKSTFNKDQLSTEVILPCCLGNTLEGSLILAVGKPYKGETEYTQQQYHNTLNQAKNVIVIVSDYMIDQARRLNPTLRVNALFVVKLKEQPTRNLPTNEQIRTESSRIDIMNDININAVTALAGPQSTVLVDLNDSLFYYRGIRSERFPTSVAYGQPVDGTFTFSLTTQPSWSNLVDLTEQQVHFRNKKFNIKQLSLLLSQLPLEQYTTYKDDILDALTQIQSILTPEEITPFNNQLIQHLKDRLDKDQDVKNAKQAYIDAVVQSTATQQKDANEMKQLQLQKQQLLGAYRTLEKQLKKSLSWLIDALGNLVSNKSSSTKKHDLNQLIRKSKIAGNVEASKNMTYESLSDLVEEHCSRIGFLIANVDSQTLTNHIQQIASSTFINVAGHQKLCTVSDRTTVLDSLDMGVLLPIVKSNHVGPLSSNTNISLSLPQDYSGYNLSTSAIPWPLFDEFISIKDPSEIQWVEHCNKPHIASLRILLRGTVAQCQASRQFVLSASSKDIGFFLASALLDTMSDLASKRSQVPTSQEFDDATCQMMRCLFGFLFTLLGSGATPLSMAWQLVMKNPQLEVPPSGDHWWLYSSIIRLFPYTGWSCRYLHQNVYSLIAKTMRKVVTDPVTEPLRKQLTVINEKVEKNYLERRNAELKFLRVAIQVIQFLDQNKKSSNSMLVDKDYKEITSRLSTLVPHQNDKKKKTGYDIVVEYVLLQSKGSKISDKLYDRVLVVSHNIIAKRSAIYKDHKKKIAKAIKSQKNCSKIALDIINKANEISDKWSGTSPRVQNLNLLQKVSKDEVDDSCKALIGDAEVSRSPWLVSDAQVEEDHSNVEALVQFVLNNTSISKEMQVKTVAVQKQVGWIAELKEHPNSKNAVALAERIKSLNVENVAELMKINKPYLDVLLGVVGDEHVLDKLKTMIEVLIKGWRDTNSAEVEAKNVLK